MIYEQRFDRITSSDLSVAGSKGVHTHIETLFSPSLSLLNSYSPLSRMVITILPYTTRYIILYIYTLYTLPPALWPPPTYLLGRYLYIYMYDSNTHYIIITHSCLVIPSRGGGGTRDARATQNSLRVSISVRARARLYRLH